MMGIFKDTLIFLLIIIAALLIFSIPTIVMIVRDNAEIQEYDPYDRFELPKGHPNKP